MSSSKKTKKQIEEDMKNELRKQGVDVDFQDDFGDVYSSDDDLISKFKDLSFEMTIILFNSKILLCLKLNFLPLKSDCKIFSNLIPSGINSIIFFSGNNLILSLMIK